jgi:glycosyltransferase 2 family protein
MSGEPVPPMPDRGFRIGNRGRWLRVALRGVVLAMAAGALVFALSVRPDTWERLAAFEFRFLPLMLLMVFAAWLCNAGRTWLLSRVLGVKLGFGQALSVTLSTEFGNAATPGGLGGIAIRTYLQHRLGLSASQTASMLAADVALDGVFFGTLWLLAAAEVQRLLRRTGMYQEIGHATEGRGLWLAAGLAAVVALALLLLQRRFASRPLWARVTRGVANTRRHLAKLAAVGKGPLALCLLLATVQGCCRYGVLPVALHALGVNVVALPLMALQGALFFIGMLVVLPGGGGSIEVLSGVLLPLFAPLATVGPAVVIWRLFTYHLYVVAGGAAFWRSLRHTGGR